MIFILSVSHYFFLFFVFVFLCLFFFLMGMLFLPCNILVILYKRKRK